jgi:hypothetical protein
MPFIVIGAALVTALFYGAGEFAGKVGDTAGTEVGKEIAAAVEPLLLVGLGLIAFTVTSRITTK